MEVIKANAGCTWKFLHIEVIKEQNLESIVLKVGKEFLLYKYIYIFFIEGEHTFRNSIKELKEYEYKCETVKNIQNIFINEHEKLCF